MEALDHASLEAAAGSVLCSTYLHLHVISRPWVSHGYGMALMLRLGACPSMLIPGFGGPQEAGGSDSYPYPPVLPVTWGPDVLIGSGRPDLSRAAL